MDDLTRALTMAFATCVFIFALSIGMYMLSKVTTTSEKLAFYSDSTVYYDNVELDKDSIASDADDDLKDGTARIVSMDTIIPVLYRYYKENFCVKIYDADNNLIQIFDMNLEGKVRNAIADTTAKNDGETISKRSNYAFKMIYDDNSQPYYMFGAPWLGSTESIKTRIDLFINGDAGYINNTYVDYTDNAFNKARKDKTQFKEKFINYSYSGQTMETEDGETLVTGADAKDKIVIIYKMIK